MRKITVIIFLLFSLSNVLKAQWELKAYGTNIYCIASNGNSTAVGSDNAIVHYSSNLGLSWTDIDIQLTQRDLFGIAVDGPKIVVGTSGFGVYLSLDSGDNWTWRSYGLSNPFVKSLLIKGPYLLAGTNGVGGMFRSANEGKTWSTIIKGLTNTLINSMASNDSNIFAATNGGGVFSSSDYGDNWTPVNVGLTDTIIYSLAINGSTLYAGSLTGVFKSTDNGRNWVKLNSSIKNVYSLAVKGNYVFASSFGSGVLSSSNAGSSWQKVTENLPTVYTQAIGISGDYVLVGVNGSGLWMRPINEMVSSVDVVTANEIGVFPNPNHGNFRIKGFNNFDRISIYNLHGVKVYESTFMSANGCVELNQYNLPVGVYTLEFYSNDNLIHKKIVIN